jgi:sugar lactone lactonase YvrE
MTPSGAVSTPYPSAPFVNNLIGMTLDSAGKLYWASNNGSSSFFALYTDRSGTVVQFSTATNTNNLRFGPDGHLYAAIGSAIADFGTNPNASFTPVSLSFPNGITQFNNATDMAWDSSGVLYVTDTGGSVIWRIDPTSTPWAAAYFVVGTFSGPSDLVFAPNGDLYVTDNNNDLIRRVTPGGVITTVAGAAGVAGLVDGVGTSAEFHNPCGIAIDSVRNRIYISDQSNNVIRVIQ